MIIVELFIVMFISAGIALLSMTVRDKYTRPVPSCPAYLCDQPAQLWREPDEDTPVVLCKSCWEKHLYTYEQLQQGAYE